MHWVEKRWDQHKANVYTCIYSCANKSKSDKLAGWFPVKCSWVWNVWIYGYCKDFASFYIPWALGFETMNVSKEVHKVGLCLPYMKRGIEVVYSPEMARALGV